MKTHIVLMSLMLLASSALRAEETESFDSNAAFSRLKTLAGEWQADTSMGKVRVEYEVIAGGNTLVEKEFVGEGPARMEARAFNHESGELRFEFMDITNLKSASAAHMRNARFRFIDSNRFVSEWELYENGRLKSTETFNFARTR